MKRRPRVATSQALSTGPSPPVVSSVFPSGVNLARIVGIGLVSEYDRADSGLRPVLAIEEVEVDAVPLAPRPDHELEVRAHGERGLAVGDDGLDLLARIRAEDRHGPTRLVVMT